MTEQGEKLDINDPANFERMPEKEQLALLEWIRLAVQAAGRPHAIDSYGLKHEFEREGFYITNGQFKGALLAAGFRPAPQSMVGINWRFYVKSACSRRQLPEDLRGQVRFTIRYAAPETFARHHQRCVEAGYGYFSGRVLREMQEGSAEEDLR